MATWQQIESLLDRVLELEAPERTRYIEEHIDDDELKDEIRSLLYAELHAPAWIDTGVDLLLGSGGHIHEIAESIKKQHIEIDRYRIIKEIGRGGMSVVYLAERTDGEFDQQVAVKIIQPFGIDREDRFRRLRAERQILASLKHPNIARVFDGGVTPEGWPYMVMEWVEGKPITTYCREKNLDINARLHLFQKICDAVIYAHRNLVVHRDLKPGNILVTESGEVKLLDFGIAKLLEEDKSVAPLTQTGLPLMTPEYAAPEQFRGETVTTSVDVYSLGVLLYELLVGERPYDLSGKSIADIEKMVCEEEPLKPSETSIFPAIESDSLKGDLDIISMKALRKEPELRYGSVRDLQEDINRYLTGLPIAARPATARYRIRKFVRRHRAGVAGTTLVVLMIVGFITALIYQQAVTLQERNRAVTEAQRAEAVQEFLVGLFRSAQPDRPRDQLPDTEEILSLGARRAMDEASAPAPERFTMLHTLAEVYISQNFLDQARPLVAAAVELARRDRLERPEDFAYALQQQGWLDLREDNYERAESLFKEAEEWLSEYPEYANIDRDIRAKRGYLQVLKYDIPQALAILEPLYQEISDQSEIGNRIRYQVMRPLRIAYSMAGDLEAVTELQDKLTPIIMEREGPESLRFAVHLANIAGTKRELGRFQEAETDLNHAIELYNKIFDRPVEYRAAARHQLARVFFYRGEFARALDLFDASNAEWAMALGIAPEEYPLTFLEKGRVLTRQRRWKDASTALERSMVLLEDDSSRHDMFFAYAKALHAWTVCGDTVNQQYPKQLETALQSSRGLTSNTAEYQAQIHETRAECLLKLRRPAEALDEIDQALAAITAPGRALEIADRRLLRYRILSALGRESEIPGELDFIERQLASLNLVNTPVNTKINAIRSSFSK